MNGNPASAYHGRRVLITGASGFIGRHLARTLHDAGADVHQLVRADAPTLHAAGTMIVADLSLPGAGADVVQRVAPEVVFDLAGYGVDHGERDDALAWRLNAEWPAELASAVEEQERGWRGQRIVHAGSALEYGTASGDLGESTTIHPTTTYGRSKAAGTDALLAGAAARGVRAAVARLFTVYGSGEHPERLLPTLRRASGGDGVIPLTAGTQRRDFTWVGDVVEGVLRLGAVEGGSAGIVNLATGRLATVREFVERAAAELGIARDRLAFGALPTRAEEMAHDDVNVSRLRALTGWVPHTTIEAGIRRSIAGA